MNNYREYDTVKIVENAIIIYDDRTVTMYEAIYITETEVEFGKISNDVFIKYGGIPIDSVKQINAGNTKLVLRKIE